MLVYNTAMLIILRYNEARVWNERGRKIYFEVSHNDVHVKYIKIRTEITIIDCKSNVTQCEKFETR